MNTLACYFLLITSVLLVNAAPAPEPAPEAELLPEVQRVKRSNYGPSYGAPSYGVPQCGAAAPAAYHVNTPSHAPQAYGYPAHALPAPYSGYSLPHYRSEDFGEELDSFNEMEHGDQFAKMRSYGGYDGAAAAAAASHIGLSHLNAPVATGPAIGLFPGVNTGGCNVPLLLSCSPSVVPGRLVRSGSHYAVAPAAAPAPALHYSAALPAAPSAAPLSAYRGVESLNEQPEQKMENHEPEHNEPTHESSRLNSGNKHN